MPTVKHSGGGLMIWACVVATVPGHLAVAESTVNSSVYQSILESNVRSRVCQLKLDSETTKETTQCVAVVQSKLRLQPDRNAVVGL